MGIMIFFLIHYFLIFCLHKLQKLNYYNNVFFKYLQILELDLKFVN
jgi:hypothetical protein